MSAAPQQVIAEISLGHSAHAHAVEVASTYADALNCSLCGGLIEGYGKGPISRVLGILLSRATILLGTSPLNEDKKLARLNRLFSQVVLHRVCCPVHKAERLLMFCVQDCYAKS